MRLATYFHLPRPIYLTACRNWMCSSLLQHPLCSFWAVLLGFRMAWSADSVQQSMKKLTIHNAFLACKIDYFAFYCSNHKRGFFLIFLIIYIYIYFSPYKQTVDYPHYFVYSTYSLIISTFVKCHIKRKTSLKIFLNLWPALGKVSIYKAQYISIKPNIKTVKFIPEKKVNNKSQGITNTLLSLLKFVDEILFNLRYLFVGSFNGCVMTRRFNIEHLQLVWEAVCYIKYNFTLLFT